jgi:hypothetical protein
VSYQAAIAARLTELGREDTFEFLMGELFFLLREQRRMVIVTEYSDG